MHGGQSTVPAGAGPARLSRRTDGAGQGRPEPGDLSAGGAVPHAGSTAGCGTGRARAARRGAAAPRGPGSPGRVDPVGQRAATAQMGLGLLLAPALGTRGDRGAQVLVRVAEGVDEVDGV